MNKEPKASNINNDLIIYRLDEIKSEIVDIKRQYVTKEESTALRIEIQGLREEIHAIKKSRNLTNWLYPTMSAVFTAVFTYLILQFLSNK
jgi:hypothetical protein